MKLLDAAAILVSLLAGLSGVLGSVSAPAATAVRIITPSGEYRYRLDQERTVRVRGALGSVSVEIRQGRVRVSESGCPDRICLHRGWVSRGGDGIICVPNRVVIRLEETSGGFDAVTE